MCTASPSRQLYHGISRYHLRIMGLLHKTGIYQPSTSLLCLTPGPVLDLDPRKAVIPRAASSQYSACHDSRQGQRKVSRWTSFTDRRRALASDVKSVYPVKWERENRQGSRLRGKPMARLYRGIGNFGIHWAWYILHVVCGINDFGRLLITAITAPASLTRAPLHYFQDLKLLPLPKIHSSKSSEVGTRVVLMSHSAI